MGRFARIDSQIRAKCLIHANRFRVPELNPFCESRLGPLKNCELQVWGDSRESLEHDGNGFFFCELIRASRFARIAPIHVANHRAIRGLSKKAHWGVYDSERRPRKQEICLGGSLVGVWNGWGYGIAIFRALNFQISEPEISQKSLFLRNFHGFSWKIRPLKNIFWTLANGHSMRH